VLLINTRGVAAAIWRRKPAGRFVLKWMVKVSSFRHHLLNLENVGSLNQGPVGEELVAKISLVFLSATTLP